MFHPRADSEIIREIFSVHGRRLQRDLGRIKRKHLDFRVLMVYAVDSTTRFGWTVQNAELQSKATTSVTDGVTK